MPKHFNPLDEFNEDDFDELAQWKKEYEPKEDKEELKPYELFFIKQSEKALFVRRDSDSVFNGFWVPKSQIEVEGISKDEAFNTVECGDDLTILMADWLAEDKGLL